MKGFIDDLDISGLGFKTEPNDTGRPAYHPTTMLKIYVYGYLNRVQSSRRLEREAGRNVELMWLTGQLAPDFKTIADFRKNNGEAIRLVCKEFVMLCKKLDLFADAFVASADRQEPDVAKQKTERLEEKITKLKQEMERLKKLEVRMRQAPDEQISLTDPDARSMATSGRGTGMVGYNVQTVVDTKHHLIVTHEVTNHGCPISKTQPTTALGKLRHSLI